MRRARAELRSNLRELRRMAVDAAHSDRRQDLQERNGRLTSALIAWRPARPSNDACSANGSRHDRSD
ncbi:hypothetical protein [Egicoccus sp. AB-alg2]|uniref:hypothetical protein n=1 Tax=Egicoccus sp. AB-alg2 TaxID=3242693 RepID=UPI00359D70F3